MEIMIVLYYMMLAYLLCANVLAIYCYIHICINDNVSPLHNISNVLTMGCKNVCYGCTADNIVAIAMCPANMHLFHHT